MTDSGNGDDLWANTRPEGTPQPEPGLPDPDLTPPAGAPGVGGEVPPSGGVPPGGIAPGDPTVIQPVVPGAAGGGAGGAPPPAPPGGGEPPFGDEEPGGPPPWLVIAAIALVVLLLLGLLFVFLRDDDDATPPSTLPATETTTVDLTTSSGPDTTLAPETTSTSTVPDTSTTSTEAPTTTAAATTTTSSTTTTAATTTTTSSTTTTTVAPDPQPDPGFARIDGETVPIEASCFVVPFAPNTGDYQVTSFLMTTSDGRVQVERWFDEGTDGVDLLLIPTGATATDQSVEQEGSAFVATMSGGIGTFEIAVNPPPDIPDCLDSVVTSETSIDEFPHTQAVLDLCVGGDGTIVAYLTELGRTQILDTGGTAMISYTPRAGESPYLDPAGTSFSDGGFTSFEGTVVRVDESLLYRAGFDLAGPRACGPGEVV